MIVIEYLKTVNEKVSIIKFLGRKGLRLKAFLNGAMLKVRSGVLAMKFIVVASGIIVKITKRVLLI